jgi:hypothetical protein
MLLMRERRADEQETHLSRKRERRFSVSGEEVSKGASRAMPLYISGIKPLLPLSGWHWQRQGGGARPKMKYQ